MQLVPRAERMVERQIRNKGSCFKAKVFVQKKGLSLPIILSPFTSGSTKVYRTLKDKSLRKRTGVDNSKLVLNIDYLKDKSKNIISIGLLEEWLTLESSFGLALLRITWKAFTCHKKNHNTKL